MNKLFEFFQHIGDWRVLVQTRDICNKAINNEKMADQSVDGRVLKDGEVTTPKLRDSAVTPEKLSPEVLMSLLYDIGVDADGTLWVILGNPKGVDIPDEDWQRMSFHDYHERRVMVARDLEDEVCPVELQESGECTVIYENAGDEEYTVSISPRYKTAEGENVTLTVPVGGYAEVSYLKSGGVVYVRGV